jgi:hypothetical protein
MHACSVGNDEWDDAMFERRVLRSLMNFDGGSGPP